jgi:GT2 family glycosyltransferase
LGSFLPLRNGVGGEVIVVDNASSDGSAAAVEAAFPAVRVLRNPENLGFAGGVNVGLRAASEDLVLLLNTDTLVVGNAIGALLDYAERNPQAGIIGPRVVNRDGSLQPSCWRFPSLLHLLLSATYLYKLLPGSRWLDRERLGGRNPNTAGPVDAVSGCCFLIRRAVIERVGVLDAGYFMYAEETDLCWRAWQQGFEVHYAPVGEIVHFGGGSSQGDRTASRRMFVEFRRSMLRFFHKHKGPAQAFGARVLLLLFLLLRTPYWALRACLPGRSSRDAAARLWNCLAGIRFLLGGWSEREAGT